MIFVINLKAKLDPRQFYDKPDIIEAD